MTEGNQPFMDAAAELDAPPPQPAEAVDPDPGQVLDVLRTVIDPEIGLDVVTLGLVYEIGLDGGTIRVTFTLTTPGCPMEQHISEGIRSAVSAVPGVDEVELDLVWEPRWHAGMIEEGAW